MNNAMVKAGPQKDVSVEYTKCLRDYFGSDTGEEYTHRDNPIKKKFCDELAAIHAAGAKFDIGPGTMLRLVMNQFRWNWDTIPYGQMDTVRVWMSNNGFRWLQILKPAYHNQIMSQQDPYAAEYIKWFQSWERRVAVNEADNW